MEKNSSRNLTQHVEALPNVFKVHRTVMHSLTYLVHHKLLQ